MNATAERYFIGQVLWYVNLDARELQGKSIDALVRPCVVNRINNDGSIQSTAPDRFDEHGKIAAHETKEQALNAYVVGWREEARKFDGWADELEAIINSEQKQ